MFKVCSQVVKSVSSIPAIFWIEYRQFQLLAITLKIGDVAKRATLKNMF